MEKKPQQEIIEKVRKRAKLKGRQIERDEFKKRISKILDDCRIDSSSLTWKELHYFKQELLNSLGEKKNEQKRI